MTRSQERSIEHGARALVGMIGHAAGPIHAAPAQIVTARILAFAGEAIVGCDVLDQAIVKLDVPVSRSPCTQWLASGTARTPAIRGRPSAFRAAMISQ